MNETEENDAFQIDHVRSTRNDRRRSAKKSRFTHEKGHERELKRFQNDESADRKRTSVSAFKENGKPDHNVTDDAGQRRIFSNKRNKA